MTAPGGPGLVDYKFTEISLMRFALMSSRRKENKNAE